MKYLLIILFLLSLNGLSQTRGCMIGNSTFAQRSDVEDSVALFVLTLPERQDGHSIRSLAVGGSTIDAQMNLFLANGNKSRYNWVVVEIGLNDLDYTEAASVAMARYQLLIDTIRYWSPTAKIIVGTMTPCRERQHVKYGEINGEVAYQKWLLMNESIMGLGAFPIDNVDARVNGHTAALNDGTDNLQAIYDTGDYIHETNPARMIIASYYRAVLQQFGFVKYYTQTTSACVGKYFIK